VPTTSLNGRIDGARRFVAQSWPFDRIHDLARPMTAPSMTRCSRSAPARCAATCRITRNCRRVAENHGPGVHPQEGDLDSGNAIAFISADLGDADCGPVERLPGHPGLGADRQGFFKDMSPKEAELVSLIMQLPTIALMSLGLISRLPPYNLAISNVPGIRRPCTGTARGWTAPIRCPS
jgi:diacylglycerol O-acyltransferase